MMKLHTISLNTCLFFSLLFSVFNTYSITADLIIFSFDRPLQLFALLESVECYFSNLGQARVIYRYSNEEFLRGYEEVQQYFPWAQFENQSPVNPHQDFKPLMMNALHETPSDYILFAVDDIIVTDPIDIDVCIKALEKYDAYGFFLRLGKNITYSYLGRKDIPIPNLTEVEPDMYTWRFGASMRHWAYSNSLDMVIYRKAEIIEMFKKLPVERSKTPNLLEGFWMGGFRFPGKIGLCFSKSQMVNIPVNLVQEIWVTRHSNSYSTKELLALFNEGKKIDISQLYNYNNISIHEEVPFIFIDRT